MQIPDWWHLYAARQNMGRNPLWGFRESVPWIFYFKSDEHPPSELTAIRKGRGADAAIVQLVLDSLPVALDPSREVWSATRPFQANRLSLVLTGNALRAGMVPIVDGRHGQILAGNLTVKRMREGFAEVMALPDSELLRAPHDALAWFTVGALCAGLGTDKATTKRFARLLDLLPDVALASLPSDAVDLGCPSSQILIALETARRRGITIPSRIWPDNVLEAHWDNPGAVLWLAATGGTFSDHLLAAARLCGHLAPFQETECTINPAAAYRAMLDRLEATLIEENYRDHFSYAHAAALRACGTRPETDDVCRRVLAAIQQDGNNASGASYVLHAVFASLAEPARLKDAFGPVIERLAKEPYSSNKHLDLIRAKLGITSGRSPLAVKLGELFGNPSTTSWFTEAEVDDLITLYSEEPFFSLIRDALGSEHANVQKLAIWLVAIIVRDAVLVPELAFLAARAKLACVVGGKPFTDALLDFDRAVETRSKRRDSRDLVPMIAAEMGKDRINPQIAQPFMHHLRAEHGFTKTARIVYRVDGDCLSRLTKAESEAMLQQQSMAKYAEQTVRLIEAYGPAKSALRLTELSELVVMELDYGKDGVLQNGRGDLFMVYPRRTGRSIALSPADARLLRAKITLTDVGERVVRERMMRPFDIEAHIQRCREFHNRVAAAMYKNIRGFGMPPSNLGV